MKPLTFIAIFLTALLMLAQQPIPSPSIGSNLVGGAASVGLTTNSVECASGTGTIADCGSGAVTPAIKVTTTLTYNVNSPPANSVVCYKANGIMGWASNTSGVIGTTCN